MSASTSEPAITPGSSSGLSPQALYEKQHIKQSFATASHEPRMLQRLHRLRDICLQRGTTGTKPLGQHKLRASKHRLETPCDSDDKPQALSVQPEPNLQTEGAEADPSRQRASRDGSASKLGMPAEGKQAPSMRKGIADAPRQFADPLSVMQAKPRRRSKSEILHLFKGKASAALAQRKHLRPAKLTPSFDINSNNRAVHRQQQSHGGAARRRHCGADAPAAHATRRPHKQQAHGLKVSTIRGEQARRNEQKLAWSLLDITSAETPYGHH